MPTLSLFEDETQVQTAQPTECHRKINVSFAIGLIVCVSLLYRTTVAMTQPYSGHAKPPRFGDFEAQRHWMEITLNLPIKEWYKNSTENDLEYWGLDYPPLTAYHSWLCGKVAQIIGWDDIVQLSKSRGIETWKSKFFMRSTALVADLLVFIPAVVFFVGKYYKSLNVAQRLTILLMSLLQPALVLIDHGHFQYNSICLGLSIWAVNALMVDRIILASILFSLALNYKQMALYYSLPFFFYILRLCWERPTVGSKLFTLIKVGLSVLVTFFICWSPWLLYRDAGQVLARIFPFHRGLYEDKVGNFWCSTSMAIKWQKIFTREQLVLLSMFITLISCVPSCLFIIFGRGLPIRRLLIGMIGCSFSFYLFSFHVHEKTILFPLMPVIMLMGDYDRGGLLVNWIAIVSTFSMYPLFVKDELCSPYYASMIAYVILTWSAAQKSNQTQKRLFLLSVTVMAVIQAINSFATAPSRYPDLFTYFCVMYSCLHFILGATYLSWRYILMITKRHVE